MAYISSLDRKRDYVNTIAFAKKEALEQGIEKGKQDVIENLLSTGRFTTAEIANFAEVPEDFIEKVRADIERKK